MLRSFVGVPEVHDPRRGRVRGQDAFERFVREQRTWLDQHDADHEAVRLIVTPERTIEEVLLRFGDGTVVPVAVVVDHDLDARIHEIRVYHSSWPLTQDHAVRPPLLQPSEAPVPDDHVGAYHAALSRGDLDNIVATFEDGGYAREPAGGDYLFSGSSGLRQFYGHLFSNDGGIPLEHCTVTDDGTALALEYNVTRWGRSTLRPQAGVGVYVRGATGKLASAHIYDDTDPPLSA